MRLSIITVCAWAPWVAAGAQPPKVTEQAERKTPPVVLTYLANEGLLLESNGKGVLIDALFRQGVKGYARVEPKTLEQLETSQAPFDSVKLVLVTHYHQDHFDAESIVRHLTNNKDGVLVTSQQVVDTVREQSPDYEGVKAQIHGFAPGDKEKVESTESGVKVELFKLSHGTGRFANIWNLGYVVQLGGQRILHIGDAELNDGSFEPLALHARNVDVACIPYWWLKSRKGTAFIRDTLKPKHIVAIHIPPHEAADVAKQIAVSFPDAMVCSSPMQRREF